MGFLSYLISGISLGGIYAIIALGYTMVYGIAKMLNFAHGDVIMLSAYMSFMATAYIGWSPLASVVLAMAVCTLLGIIIERLAYKPLRNATSLAVLITAIGVVIFAKYRPADLVFQSQSFTSIISLDSLRLFDGQLIISSVTLVTIAAYIVIVYGLTMIVRYSKIGKAMRAVSEDKEAAQLMGIDVNKPYPLRSPSAVVLPRWRVFCSVRHPSDADSGCNAWNQSLYRSCFRRNRLIPGAMLGGILLGVIEILGKACISTELSDAIVFGSDHRPCSPTGLLGKKSAKV